MYSGTCLIRHTKGPGKYVGLYRMSEYSGFILLNRNTFETINLCPMSEDLGKLRCRIAQVTLYILSTNKELHKLQCYLVMDLINLFWYLIHIVIKL